MRRWALQAGVVSRWFIAIVSLSLLLPILPSEPVEAVPTLINATGNQSNGANTISATLPSAATAGNLVVVICTIDANTTITTPVGFTVAISQAGSSTIPSQAIFYKTAVGGESTIQCAFGATSKVSVQISQFDGIYRAPYPATGFTTGSAGTYSSGTVNVSNYSDALLISGFMVPVNATISGWGNSFTEITGGGITNGNPNGRMYWSSAYRTVAAGGSYATTASVVGNTSNYRGQIVAFRAVVPSPINSLSLVNSAGAPASSFITMPPVSASFACETVTTPLFDTNRRIRFVQTVNTSAPGLQNVSMNISPVWTGPSTYETADASGAGCTNGQATIIGSGVTLQKASGPCAVPGSAGASGTKALDDSVGGGTEYNFLLQNLEPGCVWDIYGFDLSQKIPAEKPLGGYSIQVEATVVSV